MTINHIFFRTDPLMFDKLHGSDVLLELKTFLQRTGYCTLNTLCNINIFTKICNNLRNLIFFYNKYDITKGY